MEEEKTIAEVFGEKSQDFDAILATTLQEMSGLFANPYGVPEEETEQPLSGNEYLQQTLQGMYKEGGNVTEQEAQARNISTMLALKKLAPEFYEEEIDISDYTPHGTYSEAGFEKKYGFDPGSMAIDTLAYNPGDLEKLLISGTRGGKESEVKYTKEGMMPAVESQLGTLATESGTQKRLDEYYDPENKLGFLGGKSYEVESFADRLKKSLMAYPEELVKYVQKFEKTAK